jgi:ATP-dependent DNA helicase RecQ
LALTDSARDVLRGDVPVQLRVPAPAKARSKPERAMRGKAAEGKPPPVALNDLGAARFAALKAWRAEVAREHNLPAYIVFHDATLAEMARSRPTSLDEIAAISGVGARKLQAYGEEILRVLDAAE